jgi:hypothetical protein
VDSTDKIVFRNRLLADLPPADLHLLLPSLETVPLNARQVLEAPRTPIGHVYFIERGLVSVVGTAQPDHRIEVGMVGYEGMTGLGVVLGDGQSANETLVQSSGSARRRGAEGSPGCQPDLDRHAAALCACLHDAGKPDGVGERARQAG